MLTLHGVNLARAANTDATSLQVEVAALVTGAGWRRRRVRYAVGFLTDGAGVRQRVAMRRRAGRTWREPHAGKWISVVVWTNPTLVDGIFTEPAQPPRVALLRAAPAPEDPTP